MGVGMSLRALTWAKVNDNKVLKSCTPTAILKMVDLFSNFRFHFFALFPFEDACPERASGSEMDEQRKQQMAYQYLCHLEEAKV